MDEIKLENGKYLFRNSENGILYCDRYGEGWRNFIGDKAVWCLFEKCLELQRQLEEK